MSSLISCRSFMNCCMFPCRLDYIFILIKMFSASTRLSVLPFGIVVTLYPFKSTVLLLFKWVLARDCPVWMFPVFKEFYMSRLTHNPLIQHYISHSIYLLCYYYPSSIFLSNPHHSKYLYFF